MKQLPSFLHLLFLLLLTLFYGLAFTLTGFIDLPFESFHDFLILSAQWGCVCLAVLGLMFLLSASKWVFAFTFPLLTLICTILAYFSYTLQVNMTPMLVHLIVHTWGDIDTSMSLVEPQVIIWGVVSLLVSAAIVVIRWKYIHLRHAWLSAVCGVAMLLILLCAIPSFRNPIAERLPFSIYFSIESYVRNAEEVKQERSTFDYLSYVAPTANLSDSTVTCQDDSLLVVLVIGESLRADHMQLNGYNRATNPLLSQDERVVSLPHIYSQTVFTHTSVPRIMTRADSLYPQKAYEESSFVPLFQKCGFDTYWLANQSPSDTYIYFMHECDSLLYVNSGKSLYIMDDWFDNDLIPPFEELYQASKQKGKSKQLFILHTIGSHWVYTMHFNKDSATFQPNMKSKIVSSNTQEEMINSYDNTVVSTDAFLHQLIQSLENEKAILLFLSDHGECLGEDGYYLHGTKRPQLHYPAGLVWYSKAYEKAHPEKVKALEQNASKPYTNDFLFHSILDAASIQSPVQVDSLSIFQPAHAWH